VKRLAPLALGVCWRRGDIALAFNHLFLLGRLVLAASPLAQSAVLAPLEPPARRKTWAKKPDAHSVRVR